MARNIINVTNGYRQMVADGSEALEALPSLIETLTLKLGDGGEADVATITISENEPITASIYDGFDFVEYRWQASMWVKR